MSGTVKELLQEIESLDDGERLQLERALARRLEKQWAGEVAAARKAARRGKIDQAVIDRTIERRRYGA